MLNDYRQLYSIHKIGRHLCWQCKDVDTRFDTSSYKLGRRLPRGKNKNVIGLMKNELGRKIMTEFAVLQKNIAI